MRLSNGASRPFRWVVGGNYSNNKVDQVADFDYRYTSVNETVFTVFGYNLDRAHYSNYQKLTSFAFFANGEYDLASTLTFKAGARYTRAQSSATICNTDLTGDPKGTGPFLYDVVFGGAYGTFHAGDCFAGNDLGATINGVPPGAPGQYKDTLTEDNVSWTAGLDYKPRPGLLFYANVSRGYKAGSFPAVSATSFVQYRAVKQESVTAYDTRMPFASKYQLSSNLDYEFPISDRMKMFFGTSANLRSDTIAVVGGDVSAANAIPSNIKLHGIDGYVLVDARAGIASADDRWRVSVFGKNISNQYYWNNAITSSDAIARFAGMRPPTA
ncbi:TonB-dependent receptor [Sphingomonas sp. CL5.1]|uniref:TonB-dependent receptor n=1 Tax=Sphingomonas sp. CL5.1 TaxID=2653203 RepID=UPI00158425F9|nr:TonB-dependent receptor [Sphingomonas sp. CL5.1]QKS00592.1 TonB-dependent receptor [Sphingomonas sp. CL5.1]